MSAPSSLHVPGGWRQPPGAPKTTLPMASGSAELVRDAHRVADQVSPDGAREARCKHGLRHWLVPHSARLGQIAR